MQICTLIFLDGRLQNPFIKKDWGRFPILAIHRLFYDEQEYLNDNDDDDGDDDDDDGDDDDDDDDNDDDDDDYDDDDDSVIRWGWASSVSGVAQNPLLGAP